MTTPTHRLAMTGLTTPDMAKLAGNVHGGTLLKLLEQVADVCASNCARTHWSDSRR